MWPTGTLGKCDKSTREKMTRGRRDTRPQLNSSGNRFEAPRARGISNKSIAL